MGESLIFSPNTPKKNASANPKTPKKASLGPSSPSKSPKQLPKPLGQIVFLEDKKDEIFGADPLSLEKVNDEGLNKLFNVHNLELSFFFFFRKPNS